mgnify:CR=1 FL=1
MKSRYILRGLTAVVLTVALIASLASCKLSIEQAQPVTVSVTDNGASYTVEGTDIMTVEALLEAGGVTLNEKDAVTPELTAVWKDAGADGIVISRFASVTVTDGPTAQTVELVGGTVADAITAAGFDPKNFQSDIDKAALLTDGMTIQLTETVNGFASDGVYSYYYVEGVLQTNTIVGSESEGYYYANADGAVDFGYCDGVNIDGEDWIVINGAAQKVVTAADACLYAAAQDIAACTETWMSKGEKLEAAFDYIRTNYLEGVLHDPPYQEEDWPVVCANDLFIYGKGDCFSYGAGAHSWQWVAQGKSSIAMKGLLPATAAVTAGQRRKERSMTPSGVCTAISIRTLPSRPIRRSM